VRQRFVLRRIGRIARLDHLFHFRVLLAFVGRGLTACVVSELSFQITACLAVLGAALVCAGAFGVLIRGAG